MHEDLQIELFHLGLKSTLQMVERMVDVIETNKSRMFVYAQESIVYAGVPKELQNFKTMQI